MYLEDAVPWLDICFVALTPKQNCSRCLLAACRVAGCHSRATAFGEDVSQVEVAGSLKLGGAPLHAMTWTSMLDFVRCLDCYRSVQFPVWL